MKPCYNELLGLIARLFSCFHIMSLNHRTLYSSSVYELDVELESSYVVISFSLTTFSPSGKCVIQTDAPVLGTPLTLTPS